MGLVGLEVTRNPAQGTDIEPTRCWGPNLEGMPILAAEFTPPNQVTTQLGPFMFGASSSLRHCESVEVKREVELLSVNVGFPGLEVTRSPSSYRFLPVPMAAIGGLPQPPSYQKSQFL